MIKIISNFKQFVKKNKNTLYFSLFLLVFAGFWFLFGFCLGKHLIQKDNIFVYGDIVKISDILKTDSVEKEENMVVENIYYVASSRGKYYYPSNCSLAKNLSAKNLLTFSTEEEAKSAGYIFNTRCK